MVKILKNKKEEEDKNSTEKHFTVAGRQGLYPQLPKIEKKLVPKLSTKIWFVPVSEWKAVVET